ncbi:MAG TPA: nucleotidyltransferase domain-containing protein [Gemmatimonadaceae bacterium]|nr:nucleotidyltransferase domain-containing protein [Gemmatimonadaceae bacterium]
MAKQRDPLSQVLASGALQAVLLYFATHPESTPTVRALARATGLGLGSVQTEIDRLVTFGVLQRGRQDRGLRLSLRARDPRWLALRTLVRVAAPIGEVVRAALADVPGIESAFVFGSMAMGTARPDSDVDIAIIGTPDEQVLARRTIDLGMLVDREVLPLLMRPDEWQQRQTSSRPYDQNLVTGTKTWVIRDGVPVRPQSKPGAA